MFLLVLILYISAINPSNVSNFFSININVILLFFLIKKFFSFNKILSLITLLILLIFFISSSFIKKLILFSLNIFIISSTLYLFKLSNFIIFSLPTFEKLIYLILKLYNKSISFLDVPKSLRFELSIFSNIILRI